MTRSSRHDASAAVHPTSATAPIRIARKRDLPRAATFMVVSGLLFACMGASVKLASPEVGNTVVVFFRNSVSLALLLPWAVAQGPRALATRHLPGHLVRGLAGLASMACYFFAIGHMRLADAVLLNSAFPLFIPIVGWFAFGESVRGIWRGLLLGFAGVLLILKPGSTVFSAVALVGLSSAVLAAIAQVGIGRLTRTEPVARIVLYFGIIGTLGSALVLPFGWRTPSAGGLAALIATGAFATAGQFALTRAYAHAAPALVAPFIYSGVVFAVVIDLLVWKTFPDRLFVPGAVLIAAAGAWTLRRDARARSGSAL